MARSSVSSKLSGISVKIGALSKRNRHNGPLIVPNLSVVRVSGVRVSGVQVSGVDNTSTVSLPCYSAVSGSAAIAHPILATTPFTSTLLAPFDGYGCIAARIGTFGRINKCTLKVDMHSGSGEKLLEHCFIARELYDNQCVVCPLPSRAFRAGELLTLTFSSPDAHEGDCVAVWSSSLTATGNLDSRVDTTSMCFSSETSLTPLLATSVITCTVSDKPEYPRHVHSSNGIAPRSILPQQPFSLILDSRRDGFSCISLMCGTYAKKVSCKLVWELYDITTESRTLLRQGVIDGALVEDNAFLPIKFDPIRFETPSLCELVISSPDASQSNCVAVWSSKPTGEHTELTSVAPLYIVVDEHSPSEVVAFSPFFSVATIEGAFFSGSISTPSRPTYQEKVLSEHERFTGYFTLPESRLRMLSVQCSALDATASALAQLTVTAPDGRVLGKVDFKIAPKCFRHSLSIDFGTYPHTGVGEFRFVLSNIGTTRFALCGELLDSQNYPSVISRWNIDGPVVPVDLQTTVGLAEEGFAVPLQLPHYSIRVVDPLKPLQLTESGWRGNNLAAVPVPLGIVLWSFKAPRGFLKELEIAFATYERPNFCSVEIELFRGRHTDARTLPESCMVARRVYDARIFQDNQGFIVQFDEVISSRDEWFTAVVKSPDNTPRDRVSLWCRTFSSHDGVHANLLEPATQYLNALDFTTHRVNLPALATYQGERLRAGLQSEKALIVTDSLAYVSLAESLSRALLLGGIKSELLFPGAPENVISQLLPVDVVFIVSKIPPQFHDLLKTCKSVGIPIVGLDGVTNAAPQVGVPFALDYTFLLEAENLTCHPVPNTSNALVSLPLEATINAPQILQHFARNNPFLVEQIGFTQEDIRARNGTLLSALLEENVSSTSRIKKLIVVSEDLNLGARVKLKLAPLTPNCSILLSDLNLTSANLLACDAVLLFGVSHSLTVEKLIGMAHTLYVPVGVVEDDWFSLHCDPDTSPLHQSMTEKVRLTGNARLQKIVDFVVDVRRQNSSDVPATLQLERVRFAKRRLPKISIISVLYGKQREIPYFLEALERQTYRGPVELILVNDCSPDGSVAAVESYYYHATKERPASRLPHLSILHNAKNTGNCGSRNKAIEVATGDILLIVDADCLLNQDCLRAHAESHAVGDGDVAIGYFNLETGDRDPIDALIQFERNPLRVEREAEMQDPLHLPSFLNCITRNFSIRREFLVNSFGVEPLFDTLFSYSKDPSSGFGWEDVEMGFRLYERGARIKFEPGCFSVHVSHLSNVDEKSKPVRSLKNFRRLLDKHPSIVHVARRWVTDTFGKIDEWLARCKIPTNDDLLAVRARLCSETPEVFCIPKKRPLRILSFRWHCPHQYEIYKLPHTFTLLAGLGPDFTRSWNYEERPLRPNVSVHGINPNSFNEKDYDIAILHFDENSLSTENCNGVLEPDWGASFQWFVKNISIPKIAICHGTPQFYGQYNPHYTNQDSGEIIEQDRVEMVRFLSSIPVVCNSYQAQREWGFRNSRVIWQGFDPTEFPATTYQKGILSLGRRIAERPIYRGLETYQRALSILPSEFHPASNNVEQPSPDYLHNSPSWSRAKFRNYVNDIRQYSLYFNPTERSPMPRSRGEAMMCGLVPISALNHDVEMFIQNGWNGFFSNSPEELGDFMLECLRYPQLVRELGTRARATAIDLFNHDRFMATWQTVLNELVGA